MAIVKMKKLKLLISRADRDNVLRELALMGCVEVSQPDEVLADQALASQLARETSELDKYKNESARLARGLDIMGRFNPVKSGLFAAKPEVEGASLLDAGNASGCLAQADELDELDNLIRRLSAEENAERALIESLRPWESLKLSLDNRGTDTCAVLLGTVPASLDVNELRAQMRVSCEESDMFAVSSDRDQHYLCIVCLKDKQAALGDELRRLNFSPPSFGYIKGTAASGIAEAEKRLDKLASDKNSASERIIELSANREALRLCYDHISTKIDRAEASEKLLGTEYSLLLTGWVAAPSEPRLLVTLSKYTCAWDLTDPSPDEYEQVPVLLKNSPVTRPLSMVTEMYSLPAYNGVDPNPLMMPFFVLFYGLMMADMGYGLIMMIAAILVKRKKPRGGMRNFFDLLLMCGISTFVVGALTAGFFGDAPTQIAALFGAEFAMYKPLFTPLENTTEVLIGALVLGFIHIIFGMGISFVKQVREGHALDAVFDIGSWWLVFIGIALGALGITWWAAIAGAAMIVLTAGRAKPNILGKLASGFGGLYNITAYFGDILSYSRVMALMLAGGVIAQVFNTLGALTGNIVTFLIIFALGHALNMALNLLGCFVHDMRLQCLEFFGKFYQDGGRPFSPLSVKTKYSNIIIND